MNDTHSGSRGRQMMVPIFAVLLGFVWLAAGIAADDPRGGLIAMAIMFLYAAVLAVAGSRAEPFRLLRGDPQDERQARLLTRVQASTQLTIAPVLVAGTLWAVATNASSEPVWLGLTAFNGLCQLGYTFYYSKRH